MTHGASITFLINKLLACGTLTRFALRILVLILLLIIVINIVIISIFIISLLIIIKMGPRIGRRGLRMVGLGWGV